MVQQQRFWNTRGRHQDMPLWNFLTEFYLRRPELGSERSREQHRIQAGHFHRWWLWSKVGSGQYAAPPLVSDLTKATVTQAMAWVREQRGVTAATANKLALHLHAVANYAAELDEERPLGRWARYPLVRRDPDAWTIEEFGRIVDAARTLGGKWGDTPRAVFTAAWLYVAYNTGDRTEAVWSMRWDWIDFPGRSLRIPGEYRKDREDLTVSLLDDTANALLALLSYRSGPRVWSAWPYDAAGSPRKAWSLLIKKLVYFALVDASRSVDALRKSDVHTAVSRRSCCQKIRRTFATEVAANSDLETASRLCGHSSARTTARSYVDPSKLPSRSQRDLLRPVETGPRLFLPHLG